MKSSTLESFILVGANFRGLQVFCLFLGDVTSWKFLVSVKKITF